MAQRKRSSARSASRKAANGRRGSARRAATRKPNALAMLREDHERVGGMFERFERTRGGAQKERLATTICDELTIHTQLEEQVFYPAVREAIDDDDLMNEADVEHASAKDLIKQIRSSSASDPRYDAMVTVLGEYVKHHIDEEQSEMFKKARAADLDLGLLGDEMREAKRRLKGGLTGRITSLLGGDR
jgi:hemerythrin superfamily protein